VDASDQDQLSTYTRRSEREQHQLEDANNSTASPPLPDERDVLAGPRRPLQESVAFTAADIAGVRGKRLIDLRQQAFSDWVPDDIGGVVAEYLVGPAFGCPGGRRRAWVSWGPRLGEVQLRIYGL
jgi:hypothetical protein